MPRKSVENHRLLRAGGARLRNLHRVIEAFEERLPPLEDLSVELPNVSHGWTLERRGKGSDAYLVRVVVAHLDGASRETVMELTQQNILPHVVNLLPGVTVPSVFDGRKGRQLLKVTEHHLGLAIEELVVGLRGVSAAVQFEIQLAVPGRKLIGLGRQSVKEIVDAKLLRHEAIHAGEATELRKLARVSESVGQPEGAAARAELFLKESLAVEELTDERLAARHVGVVLDPAAADGMELASGNLALDALVGAGVVALQPLELLGRGTGKRSIRSHWLSHDRQIFRFVSAQGHSQQVSM
ncbi:hypothetical protein L249_6954 [Ophiocordyceps polyrhachis-furcata BCC 54312]|uniref:Uncharacterized protein n=1 Tax=Ophiocordyceps polyrhachis-furcata BCC 54312 TaxID=1330021 RepID=A0A367LJV3_9HYPO|nr:hypothetical protein L249_6954 [Ophiocordyceps polyrhachis-furcata BCC 54312]